VAQLGEAVHCVIVTQLGAIVLRWLCKEHIQLQVCFCVTHYVNKL
jgi:hypothetical protein